ncbi:MAG TPA: outer membrane protein assembly factor BamE [Ramlibacter sp.]|uniref:outer membrane protein assembly factor BamE n=1 Tax=Ramlibacter sp. TaxID=1917967 RepID=UPI002D80E3BA|nr:outer membrane protein assembly factor BamE [Ramlibacter sp.]HET8746217.1 outer membrane protein assembly factor BamE [Ramlibacter sp.]
MLVTPPRRLRLVLAAVAATLLAGCGSYGSFGNRLGTALTPYKVEVVQGNFISREQVQALQPGMSRDQVRQILGTPLVTSLFHGDRWDYVFTLRRQGVAPQQRHLAVFFQGDAMARVEGDPMPSEAEFVSTLDNRRKGSKVPRLEATEEELRKASAKQPPAPAPQPEAPAAAAPAPATNYPPLESPAR